jgi:hypothetical protein
LCKEYNKFENDYYLSEIWYYLVHKDVNKNDVDLLKSFIQYLIAINSICSDKQSSLFIDIISYLNCFLSVLFVSENYISKLQCYFIYLTECSELVSFKGVNLLKYFDECKIFIEKKD